MELADRVLAGDVRAVARLMRDLDDDIPGSREELARLHARTGHARVVGVTGNPGSGKSTLTNELIRAHRAAGRTVGVVAVDPSSPFSGGAILGDRIRMMEHATDEGVFIRSLATRGALGGLSRSTSDVVAVLDAMGKDVIIVETVGVGQDEVDIIRLADTVVVVCVPGLGDEVQAIKAGIMEIADVFVVNKADREGADRTVRELEMMLHLRDQAVARAQAERMAHGHHAAGMDLAPAAASLDWEPPIIKTVAQRGEGVAALLTQVDRHHAHMEATGGLLARRQARARRGLLALLQHELMRAALHAAGGDAGVTAMVGRVLHRQSDPQSEVAAWLGRLLRP
ncbi:MAG: methylmalonyl Co-A mutase-associated GTPase MeaB [Deltaproteobacteria bacterium]|nr:methylmalonyl Co-A mutase-associated GTPase MeaB [Deltaproteobacteria bacterium]